MAGKRPDRATIVYARLCRQAFGPTTPIVIGGIEASLRRIAHYDYWDDKILPSILVTSGADLLVYGQGEKPILEIARRLAMGEDVCGLIDVPGTAVAVAEPALAQLEARAARRARAAQLRGGGDRQARLRRLLAPLPPRAQRGQRHGSWCSPTARGKGRAWWW